MSDERPAPLSDLVDRPPADPKTCPHRRVLVNHTVGRPNEPGADAGAPSSHLVIRLIAACADCRSAFTFVGIQDADAAPIDLTQPTTRGNGEVLYVPILPPLAPA